MRTRAAWIGATLLSLLALGCASSGPGATNDTGGSQSKGVVEVVLFTHIEDQTPDGTLGTEQNRMVYAGLRSKLIELAAFARTRRLTWVLQPDWKYLEAALLYEDAALKASTNGKNVFVYLRDDLGAVIDPHSHENGGYNYPDVAYLLDQLGVGGSTVIGGHIWDPSLPQFQHWDRFRIAVAGEKYPAARWRGDILIGAGTPNHVNDPLVSGVWRPRDRDHFFDDDPAGNIVAVGAWHNSVAGVQELIALYARGTVAPSVMLTASWNIVPSEINKPTGPADIDASVFAPMAGLRDQGLVEVTDFAKLVAKWKSEFGAVAGQYKP
ncbi:MAG: hypothetical protein IPQ13_06170 [Holophagaceae bacterium]|nr:hypothetical protein [Holophagaceae bacterium]